MDFKSYRIGLLGLSLLALIVGVVTGFGAVLFRALIALIHNVAFLDKFTFAFDANQFTPASPWGPWIILVPVIGGLIVTFLVVNFARGKNSPGGRRHQIAGFRVLDRHRRGGRTRATDHPDRRYARLLVRPGH